MQKHTKEWLNNQPSWHNKDVALFVSIALVIGFFVGWLA